MPPLPGSFCKRACHPGMDRHLASTLLSQGLLREEPLKICVCFLSDDNQAPFHWAFMREQTCPRKGGCS